MTRCLVLLVLLAACSSGDIASSDELAAAQDQVASLQADLDAAEDTAAAATSERDQARSRVDELTQSLDDVNFELQTAQAELERTARTRDTLAARGRTLAAERDRLADQLEEAEAERDSLLRQFDAEITAALALVAEVGPDVACKLGEEAGSEDRNEPTEDDIRRALARTPELEGLDLEFLLADDESLVAEARRCFNTVQSESSEDDGPEGRKVAGTYTVGEEMAPGNWIADLGLRDGQFCSWSKLAADGTVADSAVATGPDNGSLSLELSVDDVLVVLAGDCAFELQG